MCKSSSESILNIKSRNGYFLSVAALVLLFSLVACGTDAPSETVNAPVPNTSEQTVAESADQLPVLLPTGEPAKEASQDTAQESQELAPAQVEPQATVAPVSQTTLADTGPVGGKVGDRAAEIEGIKAWLNSDPLTIAGLRGKVVLVDFWTYTCINCIRTYPFLKLWNARYSDDGLVIIGVHSPEFHFEKDLANVTQATIDDGILWPVALDNDFVTWENYSNRFWPAKYLIDKDGFVRYTHFGEGEYAGTEQKIRELLMEAGADILEDDFAPLLDQSLDPVFQNSSDAEVTRELYAGHLRNHSARLFGQGGYVGQEIYYSTRDEIVNFALPGGLTPHVLYFEGPWRVGEEDVTHGRITQDHQDSINLVYSARSVNAVLTSGSEQPYRVRITLDGQNLTPDNKGEDVTIGEDGESYVLVTEPRMYNLVENPEWVWQKTLKMSSNSDDFGLFAFTFGIYQKVS